MFCGKTLMTKVNTQIALLYYYFFYFFSLDEFSSYQQVIIVFQWPTCVKKHVWLSQVGTDFLASCSPPIISSTVLGPKYFRNESLHAEDVKR